MRARSQHNLQEDEALLSRVTARLREEKELSRRVEEALRKKAECLAAELEVAGERIRVKHSATDRLGPFRGQQQY